MSMEKVFQVEFKTIDDTEVSYGWFICWFFTPMSRIIDAAIEEAEKKKMMVSDIKRID